jgi:hypothetical protein
MYLTHYLGRGAIMIDLRFMKGPLEGNAAPYCASGPIERLYGPLAAQVASQLCPGAWASHISYVVPLLRAINERLGDAGSLDALRQWSLGYAGVRAWTKNGDRIFWAWSTSTPGWFGDVPDVMTVSHAGRDFAVQGGLAEYYRYPARDPQGRPSGLGVLAQVMAE